MDEIARLFSHGLGAGCTALSNSRPAIFLPHAHSAYAKTQPKERHLSPQQQDPRRHNLPRREKLQHKPPHKPHYTRRLPSLHPRRRRTQSVESYLDVDTAFAMDPKHRDLLEHIVRLPALLEGFANRVQRQEDFAAVFFGHAVAVGGYVDAETIFYVALVWHGRPGFICERCVGVDGPGCGKDGALGGQTEDGCVER